jgi:hypothetical protein
MRPSDIGIRRNANPLLAFDAFLYFFPSLTCQMSCFSLKAHGMYKNFIVLDGSVVRVKRREAGAV